MTHPGQQEQVPEGAACEAWPLDHTCLSDDWPRDPNDWTPEQHRAVILASELLWRATAGRYGMCRETIRPCGSRQHKGGRGGTGPTPKGVALHWRPFDTDDAEKQPIDLLTVELMVMGTASAVIDPGDGTPPIPVSEGEWVRHRYHYPDTFTVTATCTQQPQHRDTATVTVKTHTTSTVPYLDGADPWHALLWINEPNDGTTYRIDWGDGTPAQDVTTDNRRRKPPHPRVPHQYTQRSSYTITVTDLSTRRTVARTMDIGSLGVFLSYPDATRPRLRAFWFATTARYKVDWGDGTEPAEGEVSPSGEINVVHSGTMPPGLYQVTVTELLEGQPRRVATRNVQVPNPWDFGLPVALTWREDHTLPPTTQDVNVTLGGGTEAPVQVTWGDGSPTETLTPGATLRHDYGLPPPADGWMLKCVEQRPEQPRTWSRLLGQPRRVAEPVMNARNPRAVTLHVTGIDGWTNSDWYRIHWGDGNTEPMAAVGAWWPAYHVYGADGVYDIAIDGPGMPVPIHRTIRVTSYPHPFVRVSEDESDVTRRTVALEVDNTDVSGEVLLRWGDDTPVERHPEKFTTTHRYPEPLKGQFTIVVTPVADTTSTVRHAVTIPFHDSVDLSGVAREGLDPNGDPYPDRMTVEVEITSALEDKRVHVTYNDGSPGVDVVAPWQPVQHTYDTPGDYQPKLSYTDSTDTVKLDWVTVPFTGTTGDTS